MYTAGTSERAKDPAVANAEKLMKAITDGEITAIYNILDPKIMLNGPMGVYQSRPHVKAWLEFEQSVLQGAPIVHHGTVSVDGLKVAKTTWSVHGLHFVDVVTLNQVLSIRTVRRTMVRKYKNDAEKERGEKLLLAWTGPYFSKYCGPKAKGVDNRALVLPVLDYAYMGLKNVRDLLTTKPNGGREIQETSIVFHFLHQAAEKERDDAAAAAAERAAQESKQTTAFSSHPREEVTIRAKNRDGEQAAIVIDRSMLDGKHESRVESLEDGEVVVKEDRMRFVCSGIKLCNNELVDCRELEIVLKLYVVNAFYFLSMLDLSSNGITVIPELAQFPLQALYLHDNKISDMRETEKLKDLTQLTSLTLFGNPIQSNARSAKEYKYCVLSLFWHPPAPKPPRSRTPPRTPFEVAEDERARIAAAEAKARGDDYEGSSLQQSSPTRGGTSGGARGRSLSPTRSKSPGKRGASPSVTFAPVGSGLQAARRPPSALQVEKRKKERERLERGYVSLRTLDHSVISPIEVEAIERFVSVFGGSKSRPSSRQR